MIICCNLAVENLDIHSVANLEATTLSPWKMQYAHLITPN